MSFGVDRKTLDNFLVENECLWDVGEHRQRMSEAKQMTIEILLVSTAFMATDCYFMWEKLPGNQAKPFR
jgi:hypothetical protein